MLRRISRTHFRRQLRLTGDICASHSEWPHGTSSTTAHAASDNQDQASWAMSKCAECTVTMVSGRSPISDACREKWTEPGSNRRHQDFQSCALPTELSVRHHRWRRSKSSLFSAAGELNRGGWRRRSKRARGSHRASANPCESPKTYVVPVRSARVIALCCRWPLERFCPSSQVCVS